MRERGKRQEASFAASGNQPLIGIVLSEAGRETERYFCSELDAERAIPARATQDALALAGAWSDLAWGELEAGLNRIRHENASRSGG